MLYDAPLSLTLDTNFNFLASLKGSQRKLNIFLGEAKPNLVFY